jgi:hypothetical protein
MEHAAAIVRPWRGTLLFLGSRLIVPFNGRPLTHQHVIDPGPLRRFVGRHVPHACGSRTMFVTDLSRAGLEHYDTYNHSPTRGSFQAIDPGATSAVNNLSK